MSAARPVPGEQVAGARARFILYVEGPRDRDILRAWALRLSPALAEDVVRSSRILGGRQPERAAEHFDSVRVTCPAARGLCVLDRDDAPTPPPVAEGGAALEFFTWSRRHIESYLLVPDAIRRSLLRRGAHPRTAHAVGRLVPATGDEDVLRDIDAKRLLSAQGALSRAFGAPIQPGRLAREMFVGELHPDIRSLFDRMRRALRAVELSSLTEPPAVD